MPPAPSAAGEGAGPHQGGQNGSPPAAQPVGAGEGDADAGKGYADVIGREAQPGDGCRDDAAADPAADQTGGAGLDDCCPAAPPHAPVVTASATVTARVRRDDRADMAGSPASGCLPATREHATGQIQELVDASQYLFISQAGYTHPRSGVEEYDGFSWPTRQ